MRRPADGELWLFKRVRLCVEAELNCTWGPEVRHVIRASPDVPL
jgi:hypothetical protein